MERWSAADVRIGTAGRGHRRLLRRANQWPYLNFLAVERSSDFSNPFRLPAARAAFIRKRAPSNPALALACRCVIGGALGCLGMPACFATLPRGLDRRTDAPTPSGGCLNVRSLATPCTALGRR